MKRNLFLTMLVSMALFIGCEDNDDRYNLSCAAMGVQTFEDGSAYYRTYFILTSNSADFEIADITFDVPASVNASSENIKKTKYNGYAWQIRMPRFAKADLMNGQYSFTFVSSTGKTYTYTTPLYYPNEMAAMDAVEVDTMFYHNDTLQAFIKPVKNAKVYGFVAADQNMDADLLISNSYLEETFPKNIGDSLIYIDYYMPREYITDDFKIKVFAYSNGIFINSSQTKLLLGGASELTDF